MNNALRTRIETILPKLEGWATLDKAFAMASLILDTRPALVVEIGVFGGRSVIPQAMALRELGSGHLVAIDPWRLAPALEGDPGDENARWWTNNINLHDIHRGYMEALWRESLDDYVTTLRGTAAQTTWLLRDIDILHIDGNHTELASTRDVRQFLPLVRKNGHIWFDDIDWDSTQKALALLAEKCEPVRDVGTCRLFRKGKTVATQARETIAAAKDTVTALVEASNGAA